MPSTTAGLVFESLLALDTTAIRGISIAATGMLIVVMALSLISLFIAGLPRILSALAKIYPEPVARHGKRTHSENSVTDDEAVLAAIGFVLHTEFQKLQANEIPGQKRE
jgi:Na+-transporting methylmalonyl-CoA/oxaloacetate decarboxylase gamma subunit